MGGGGGTWLSDRNNPSSTASPPPSPLADLKIENILISKTGNIKIIDFGLSNLYSPFDHLSTFCGSLYFAAPELLNAKVYTGPEVDVWSFGIVLYVLVCGKVPFDDQSMPALHAKIKRGLVEYPAWLSVGEYRCVFGHRHDRLLTWTAPPPASLTECKALLCRMLVTDPHSRATLAEVLASPWMNKGYDTQADCHLVPREPLRSDELEIEVIRGMAGFEFGLEDSVESKLREVLESETYKTVLAHWEAKRDAQRKSHGWSSVDSRSLSGSPSFNQSQTIPLSSSSPQRHPLDAQAGSKGSSTKNAKRFSGFDFYRKKLFAPNLGGNLKDGGGSGDAGKSSLISSTTSMHDGVAAVEPLDPTRGFHPLISIYYLVREKLERERVYGTGHFASSQLSLETNGKAAGGYSHAGPPDYSMKLPRLPVPEVSHSPNLGYNSQPSPRFAAPSAAATVFTPQLPLPRPPRPTGDAFGVVSARNPAAAVAGVMQHPEADGEQSHLEDMPVEGGAPRTHQRSHSLSQHGAESRHGHAPTPPPPLHDGVFTSNSSRRPSGAHPTGPRTVEEEPRQSGFDNGSNEDYMIPNPDLRNSPSTGLVKRFSTMMGRVGGSPKKGNSATSSNAADSRSRITESSTLPPGAMAAHLNTPSGLSGAAAIPSSAHRRASTMHQRRVSVDPDPSNVPFPRSASKATYRQRSEWENGPQEGANRGDYSLDRPDHQGIDQAGGGMEAKPVYLKGLFR